tara:strand:- start:178 stop:372 length:195 start_codon:yes stop_codon:yes gene_type:complete
MYFETIHECSLRQSREIRAQISAMSSPQEMKNGKEKGADHMANSKKKRRKRKKRRRRTNRNFDL